MRAERNCYVVGFSLNLGIYRGSVMASNVDDIKFIFMDQNTICIMGLGC